MKKLDKIVDTNDNAMSSIDKVVEYYAATSRNDKTSGNGHTPCRKTGCFIRTKHLLGILGLSAGAAMTEADVLDRLNDIGAVNTPTGVSYKTGSHESILNVVTNNPYFHTVSHLLYSLGISGGPNNTLGIFAAAGSLVVGGIAARSYIHLKNFKVNDSGEYAGNRYKMALLSAGFLGAGAYAGLGSLLPVIDGTLYGAPLSTLGYAGASVLSTLTGVYLGMHYLKNRFADKRGNK
jgi:hypothetical protein